MQPDLDRQEALEFVGGDAQLLRELARIFVDSYPTQLTAVRLAWGRGDLPALACAAHSLKGSIHIFHAATFEAALRVETLARAGDAAHLAEACAGLETALVAIRLPLAALAAEADN
jgi:HPt (histidine-containing phosphotransfer) domain-containing protein